MTQTAAEQTFSQQMAEIAGNASNLTDEQLKAALEKAVVNLFVSGVKPEDIKVVESMPYIEAFPNEEG